MLEQLGAQCFGGFPVSFCFRSGRLLFGAESTCSALAGTGDRLIERGKVLEAISLVVRGKVQILMATGDIVGSAVLLSGVPADVDAVVLEPVRAMRWEVTTLERYLNLNHETRIVMLRQLARDLAGKLGVWTEFNTKREMKHLTIGRKETTIVSAHLKLAPNLRLARRHNQNRRRLSEFPFYSPRARASVRVHRPSGGHPRLKQPGESTYCLKCPVCRLPA